MMFRNLLELKIVPAAFGPMGAKATDDEQRRGRTTAEKRR
jgi:hypothetical protein